MDGNCGEMQIQLRVLRLALALFFGGEARMPYRPFRK